jgi:glycosyltransferase involved in cell wall biosynthesis
VRILVVNNLYPPVVEGGYEVECHDVVQHMRRSHEVTVLTSVRGREASDEEPGIRRQLPFVRYDKRDSLRAPTLALRAVRITRATLEDVRPDLVYVWNGSQLPHAAMRVLDYSGVPIAYRVCEHWFGGLYRDDTFFRHLTPGERGFRGIWARMMRTANRHQELRLEAERRVPAAICWNAEAVRRASPLPKTIEPVLEALVYPANARVDTFATLERRVASPPRVLFVGRLDDAKGAAIAVRALASLRSAHHVDASLVLAGDGPGMRDLKELTAELGMSGNVRFTGPLRGKALHTEVSQAAAWVIPSVWEEPAPLVCTEAALARVPAVLSRVGGISEMLHEEEHALFFAKGDHEGCAAALARVLEEDGTDARVERAFRRGQELGYEPYLAAMDGFLHDAVAILNRY